MFNLECLLEAKPFVTAHEIELSDLKHNPYSDEAVRWTLDWLIGFNVKHIFAKS